MSEKPELKDNQSLLDFFMLSEGTKFVTMAEKLITVFRQARDSGGKQIAASIMNMRDMTKLVLVQSEMLTLRQRMLEDSHILLDKVVTLRKQQRTLKARAYDRIINDMQLRMKTTAEKDAIVEGTEELSEMRHKMEILDNQIEYYSESIKTIDNILYGLKTRLDIEKMLGV